MAGPMCRGGVISILSLSIHLSAVLCSVSASFSDGLLYILPVSHLSRECILSRDVC